ncbi:MAG: hypothetical protein C0P70_010870, partial [Bacillota bacterium]
MFGLPWLEIRLALVHYAEAFLVGIAFRFYGGSGQEGQQKEEHQQGDLLGAGDGPTGSGRVFQQRGMPASANKMKKLP